MVTKLIILVPSLNEFPNERKLKQDFEKSLPGYFVTSRLQSGYRVFPGRLYYKLVSRLGVGVMIFKPIVYDQRNSIHKA